MSQYDLAIVGAGIAGLAHAWHAARRGLKVAIFERHPQAQGASIRNFGMIWPVGQPRGPLYARAKRALGHWQNLAAEAGFDLRATGSLHLAYAEDEWAVLNEFVHEYRDPDQPVELIRAEAVQARSPLVRAQGLIGAMWSPEEHVTTSPDTIRQLGLHLRDHHGVELHLGTTVTAVHSGQLIAGGREVTADRILICSGAEFETLFADSLRESPMVKCKLQMWSARHREPGFALGPCLCAGLTLLHYDAFARCPSLAALMARMDAERADAREHGVHILLSQHASGELILGDSHHYGPDPQPFDREDVQQIMARELNRFLHTEDLSVTRRWHGVYAKTPGATEWHAEPLPGVHLLNGLGGTGMTLTLGLAEEWLDRILA